ncbi:MAG: hypothetical protein ACUVSD_00615 [Thiobacillaceae bacterium]
MPTKPKQISLFDDPENRAVTVAAALDREKPTDQRQAAFRRLIRQIEAERARLAEWQTYQGRYAQRLGEELIPMQARLRATRVDLLRLLDEQYQRKGVLRGKGLRRRLRAMIVDLAQALLAEEADPELVALHDRYSDVSHAELYEFKREFSRNLMEQVFGIELDPEDDVQDMEAMMAKAMHKFEQEEQRRADRRARRRKSAKSMDAEAKREAAKKQVSQSVREVYRKLASALHPDRASTELTQARKTELMQRVNRAYEAGDLLELLNVQLEIEQIDADHLTNLSAERLDHYNTVLREQLAELKTACESLLAPFRMLVPHTDKLRPADVDNAMDAEIARMNLELQQVMCELEDLRDPKRLEARVRGYQREDPGLDGLEVITALGELVEESAQARQRRR